MNDQSFTGKGIDYIGLDTLNIISAAVKFNKWMYQAIKPCLKGNILEIGSGIGNITQYVINDKFKVTASDISESYCSILQDKFGNSEYLNEVRNIDIVHPDFDREYRDLFNTFDSILALNTIEHIENDLLAVENCKKLLLANGNLIILVPAYPSLYNRFDKALKHFRRYTRSTLEKLLRETGYKIHKTQYFNSIGIAGWWFSGDVLNNRTIPKRLMKLFDMLVPGIKIIDKLIMNSAGLSVIAFATKK